VTEQEIRKIIKSLSSKKAAGYDEIPVKFMKNISNNIVKLYENGIARQLGDRQPGDTGTSQATTNQATHHYQPGDIHFPTRRQHKVTHQPGDNTLRTM